MPNLNRISPALLAALLVWPAVTGCQQPAKNGFRPLLTSASKVDADATGQQNAAAGERGSTTYQNRQASYLDGSGSGVNGVSAASNEASGVQWLTSYDQAVEISEQTGKPILTDFTGSNWCGYCVKLKKEVFATANFQDWAADNVVLLKIDYPRPNRLPEELQRQNQQLKERYQINRFPTVLILAADGSVIGKLGYMNNATKWISVANNAIATHQSLQTADIVDAADLKNYK